MIKSTFSAAILTKRMTRCRIQKTDACVKLAFLNFIVVGSLDEIVIK